MFGKDKMTSGVNNKKKCKNYSRTLWYSRSNHFYDTSSELFHLVTSKMK